MTAAINLTHLNFTNLTAMATSMNAATNPTGLFWSFIMVGVFLIAFLVVSTRYTSTRSFMVASFMTFILSMMLFFAGELVSEGFLFAVFGLMIGSIIMSFFND